ncbi:EAL domain-containing protein [Simiduia agarivorans]|uniref:Sensor protein FixL n=1 Tax=Simiduia agarivorans (strain DSM 21679 / JCM 13881 / BCRC 17597 / SA1) TaxID=1117647 RepID=K4KPW4_SIMAS|nr:EAL domain-containing protein [Simiduia agarivorans]AFV00296.1 PAS/PAC and GAF sensor-containing diguanylate cyclase/phosphodiesterase [Simiduia agarivorans SA1 = DSM 21679]
MTRTLTLSLGVIASLLLAAAAAYFTAAENRQLAEAKLQRDAAALARELSQLVLAVEHGVRGTRGAIIAAGERFDHTVFKRYIESRDIAREFPGIPGFAWIERVPPAQREDVLRRAAEEQPGFTLRQYMPNEQDLFLLRYVEPTLFVQSGLGLDLASEPGRRQALVHAQTTNKLVLSAPLQQSQHRLQSTPDYLAILSVEADAGHRGWVLAPIYMTPFLHQVMGDDASIHLVLTDADARFSLGQAAPTRAWLYLNASPLGSQKDLNLYGRQWQLSVSPGPKFLSTLAIHDPRLIFLAVLATGLLITAVKALLETQRQQRVLLEQNQQEQLGLLIDAAPCGMMLLNASYQFIAVNKKLCEQTGYQRNELVDASFALIMGESPDGQNLQFSNADMRDNPGIDMMVRRKDGHIFPAALGLSTIRINDQNHIIATLDDVTERRKIERQIADSEATFRKLANAMPQHVWITQPDGELGYANERCLDFFKLSFDQLREQWFDQIHPDDQNHAIEQWLHATNSGEDYSCQFRLKPANGDYIWFISRAIPVEDELGNVVAWYGTNTDVSESMAAQQAVEQQAKNTQAIIDGVMDAIITINEQGLISQFNTAAEALFGYSEKEVLGKNVNLLVPDPHHHQHDQYIQNYLNGGEAKIIGKGGVVDGKKRDESLFKMELRIAEIWHQNQRQFIGMVRDITERHNNDKLLKAQDHILGMIATNTELPITLDALVRDIEELAPDLIASVLLLDSSGRRLLHGAAPSLPSEINAAINGLAIGPKVGACGTAVYYQKQIICSDIRTDPHWEDFRELALKHNLLACWSTPIISMNEVLGSFALYFRTPRTPTETHQRIINMAQHVATLAITHDRRETRIKQLAFYDSLTRLPNRALGMDRLSRAISDAQRRSESLAVMFIDLDGFKTINDSLGHHVGDRLLKLAAARLDKCVRENDTVARLGGDEFIVILHGPKDSLADVVAQKVLEAMTRKFQIDEHALHVSCSIGVALYPRDGADAQSLLRNADAAMYRAKELGRNNAQYYTEELNRAAMERITLESEIRAALERQEFYLHYQPRVNNRTGKIIGLEALVRWQHPSRGTLGPNVFIPVAEQSGLITALGEWVLNHACTQVNLWLNQLSTPLSISVNLSPRQFRDPALTEKVAHILAQSALPPELLELEITESMVMDDAHDTTVQLHQLKSLGITLAIDDFGTGYSNLSRLKHLPVDVLKIDKSFVDGIPDDTDDTAIATTIIAMGHHLNLKIVAEGVETFQQQKFLSENQCDEMQGYLFGKPVSTKDIEHILGLAPRQTRQQ